MSSAPDMLPEAGRLRNEAGAIDPERHRLMVELLRVQQASDAAQAACRAAEMARHRAEVARNAAERAGDIARDEVVTLQEKVAFLYEQVQSDQAYLANIVEPALFNLRVDRALVDGAPMRHLEDVHVRVDGSPAGGPGAFPLPTSPAWSAKLIAWGKVRSGALE